MAHPDREYYQRRLEQERLLARQAEQTAARVAHVEMAIRYANLIDNDAKPLAKP